MADAMRGSVPSLGAVIDAGGERLTLIDGSGHVLSDDEAIMALSSSCQPTPVRHGQVGLP